MLKSVGFGHTPKSQRWISQKKSWRRIDTSNYMVICTHPCMLTWLVMFPNKRCGSRIFHIQWAPVLSWHKKNILTTWNDFVSISTSLTTFASKVWFLQFDWARTSTQELQRSSQLKCNLMIRQVLMNTITSSVLKANSQHHSRYQSKVKNM